MAVPSSFPESFKMNGTSKQDTVAFSTFFLIDVPVVRYTRGTDSIIKWIIRFASSRFSIITANQSHHEILSTGIHPSKTFSDNCVKLTSLSRFRIAGRLYGRNRFHFMQFMWQTHNSNTINPSVCNVMKQTLPLVQSSALTKRQLSCVDFSSFFYWLLQPTCGF
jgi:hypothetical protein